MKSNIRAEDVKHLYFLIAPIKQRF